MNFLPLPVLIIGTYDKDGKANVMNAAWGGIHDYGKIDVDKMEIITFDMVSNTDRVLGEVVGNAFKDGLKLKD